MSSKRVSLPPLVPRDSSARGRDTDVDGPRSSTLAELSFRRNRADTLPPKNCGRSSSDDSVVECIDSSKFRRLKHMVDTGRTASSSSRPDEHEVLSPTALHDVLAVDRRNSRMVKDRLPVIIECPEENCLQDS
eukprot:CAMPEP_0185849900 /NCGR_PEP_ID=MMETSP1354-20130828/4239_1 /TAXON_ID=708628 /ORGANISM="Erythrolobus madagascarensis, Strain CCMP3276" /LENGTH=132 /DNA_ID=CAMNT_0028550505 /DNA_START=123 /DNA_END=521 /DNA_ORIENTATION=+